MSTLFLSHGYNKGKAKHAINKKIQFVF